jgi:hypothetical protein
MYAFNGEQFRKIWTPKGFVAETRTAVTVTTDSVTLRRLFDPTGRARGSPSVVIRERYALTADGPQKVAEWENSIVDEPK